MSRQLPRLRFWHFDQIAPRRFWVTFCARNGDVYQIEVDYEDYPSQPPAFHWRNP